MRFVYIPARFSSMLPQQQPLPLPSLACIGHLLDEQHVFPSAIFLSLAIIGHFMPAWLPDIIGHFPSLQQPAQAAFEPLSALSWLQQAHAFVSGLAAVDGAVGVAVCARDASAMASVATKTNNRDFMMCILEA
jgi:hypothetical protein